MSKSIRLQNVTIGIASVGNAKDVWSAQQQMKKRTKRDKKKKLKRQKEKNSDLLGTAEAAEGNPSRFGVFKTNLYQIGILRSLSLSHSLSVSLSLFLCLSLSVSLSLSLTFSFVKQP